jgi:hypothetical protein
MKYITWATYEEMRGLFWFMILEVQVQDWALSKGTECQGWEYIPE